MSPSLSTDADVLLSLPIDEALAESDKQECWTTVKSSLPVQRKQRKQAKPEPLRLGGFSDILSR